VNITLKPGHYVLAVSGGVDSMVLFDLLHKRPGVKFTVAHFDHGIRDDSDLDRRHVEDISRHHKIPFVYEQGRLGPGASEEQARDARYKFLTEAKNASGAQAVITAHHLDDLLETAILNLLRGTGRRGLSSLKTTDGIIRPLLKYPKHRIKEYADINKIHWREDSTNNDTKYKRNHVRHKIMTKLTPSQRAQFEILLHDIAELNEGIDAQVEHFLHQQPALDKISRKWFSSLSHDISKEVLHYWFTKHKVKDISRRRLEQLVVAVKTAKPNTNHDVPGGHKLHVSKDIAHLRRIA
jgi:tRNA(Ile)-lysidine synthase